MTNTLQKVIFFVCAAVLLAWAGCAALGEESTALPIDFSGGMPLKEEFFTGTWSYQDPTISVSIVKKTYSGKTYNCDYWVADIRIAHASQLRTQAATTFSDYFSKKEGDILAKRVNAVLAIDGDFFTDRNGGYVLRQGQEFKIDLRGTRDVLLIDEDGDFHIIQYAKPKDATTTINGKKVINAFYFGPALIINGAYNHDMALHFDMKADLGRQRMCIAQVGHLHYKCICCGPPARGNGGMKLSEFASVVAREGVKTAYNLDGGDSCLMFFNGEKVNDLGNDRSRAIPDIIYFASAYGAEQ